MRQIALAAAVCAAALLGASIEPGAGWAQTGPPQSPPAFRARTSLLPVDVRVVDRRGRPVADLTAADFTIEENGVRQEIRHFAPIALSSQPPGAETVGGGTAAAAGDGPPPRARRVFLIVLGRGDLQVPSKGLDGMLYFLRQRLLPQDLVAVMAWNRATDFTTDHERVARMLESYRDGYRHVESLLAQHFSGLAAIYGSRDIPDWMQKDIDAVLRGGGMATHTVIAGAPPADVQGRIRRGVDVLQQAARAGEGMSSLDVFNASDAEQMGMSLDEYVSTSVQTLQDLPRLHAGLAYLRHREGEKHMIYLSPTGLNLPSADDDRSFARVAQDARVVVNVFHTSGMSAGMWAVSSSQNIAELTGGQYTGVRHATQFADMVDTATRSGYQLGYYPSNPTLDGKYRKISIKVNRRGVEVFYRRGYIAGDDVPALDRRQVIATSRVMAALRYPRDVDDLKLTVSARSGRSASGVNEMIVQVTVDPSGLALTNPAGERGAALDVGVFCADRLQYLVGQLWRRVDVPLDDEDRFRRARDLGIGFTVHVPIKRGAKFVKVVVYDHAADRIGTVLHTIR